VCRRFIVLSRKLDLFSQSIIAIDGAKFKSVDNRDHNFASAKLRARMAQIEQSVEPCGAINMDECFYCLDCQVIHNDANVCPPLVNEARRKLAVAAATRTPAAG